MTATKRVATKKTPPKKAAAKKAPAKAAAPRKLTIDTAPKMKEAAKRKPAAPKKSAPKKSAAKKNSSSSDGVKFPDAGFHIAVLGALLDAKCISAELIQATLEGLDFDEDSSETDRLLMAMERLHTLTTKPKDLARIESLDFDGGNEIYMLLEDGAETETGGEDDTYCLQALTGIEALSGLKKLSLDGHGYREETLDLNPLEGHPALEVLVLSGKCKNATALETMPKLARLDLRLGKVDRPKVLDRLAKLGVEILQSK
jgi:hypothetical protein